MDQGPQPQPATAGRKLVVCCDGTNNTLTAGLQDTNVLRLYAHLVRERAKDARRDLVLYYDPGVGSPDLVPPADLFDMAKRWWERTAGLAQGAGIYENIGEAYLFLMRNWRSADDQIYFFGFSRGAFTVRAIAGMVHLFGILAPEHECLVPALVRIYFSQPRDAKGFWRKCARVAHEKFAKPNKAAAEPGKVDEAAIQSGGDSIDARQALADEVRSLYTSEVCKTPWVHWVGVWDTVESVGLPGPLSRSNPTSSTFLNKRVRHARHALALDEHRWTFTERLYEEADDVEQPGRSLKQRWFHGSHCDVGGSYMQHDAGLSEWSLQWMLDEVHGELGVETLAARTRTEQPAFDHWVGNASDPIPAAELRGRPVQVGHVLHDEMWDSPWWALTGMDVRDMRTRVSDGGKFKARVHPLPPGTRLTSVWAKRRPLWPVADWLLAGVLALAFIGYMLGTSFSLGPMLAEGLAFEGAFVDVLHLPDALMRLELMLAGPTAGWALLGQLVLIMACGYLLARVVSRSFAWLAATRDVHSPLPRWRRLGLAPFAALVAALVQWLLVALALASSGLNAGPLWLLFLVLAMVTALVKVLALVACIPFVLVRLWVELRWKQAFWCPDVLNARVPNTTRATTRTA